ncbi:kinase-like protein, partial [Melanomma pulvis-pyrius CBS 109.77]
MNETLKPTVADRIHDARKLLPKICGWEELRDVPPDQVERFLTPMAVLGKGSLGLVDAVVSSGRNTVPFVRKRVFLPPSGRAQLLHIIKSEANILEDLVHTHIVHLFGTYEHKPRIGLPTFSLLMFPVGDNDLAGFLYNCTNLDQLSEEAQQAKHWLRRWFSCLTSALAYIHDQGVRHQDIKPSNIIHQRDHIFFTDFSSSARFDPTSTTSTENPARNSAMYSAPEVLDRVEGSDDYQRHGTRSDVFSLGCVFVEMFAATKGVSVYDLHTSL